MYARCIQNVHSVYTYIYKGYNKTAKPHNKLAGYSEKNMCFYERAPQNLLKYDKKTIYNHIILWSNCV